MSEALPGVWVPMDGVEAWDPLRGGYAFLDRTDGGATYHCGADLNGGEGGDGDLGAPLRFPIAGEVVYVARWSGAAQGYGNHLWLRLVNGDYLHYCHCASITGEVGTAGAPGQVVASCGKSGFQTWAHLHLEVKREDPAIAGYDYWPYGMSAEYVREHYVRPADWWAQLLTWHAGQGGIDVSILSGAQTAAIQSAVWGAYWNPAASEHAIEASWRDEWRRGAWRGAPLSDEQLVPDDPAEGSPAGAWRLFEYGTACWLPGQPVSWNG